MRAFSSALALLGVASLVSAASVNFKRYNVLSERSVPPLPDGMPNPSAEQLADIEHKARGTLPNTPPPSHISPEGITSLKLIAFNELFEVAYFNDLLLNVTNNVPGYEIEDKDERNFVIKVLTAVLAQESLHALSANGALQSVGVDPIQPCEYTFPVTDFKSAIALAGTFTAVVLGTLQDAVDNFAKGGDHDVARQIASVIGNEGEQEGWYRLLQNKIPNELPFLTTSVLDFAFTAVQGFTVPGTCPNINEIPLKTFKPLTIVTPPGPKTQEITISLNLKEVESLEAQLYGAAGDDDKSDEERWWVTYINQLNKPIVESLEPVKVEGDQILANTLFPYDENLMNGLTIVAITSNPGPFANADEVVNSTYFGPGLIIVK
ncbi:sexual development protein (LsdA), putative [Paecilomyces variotii No. 5]|uniref:Sexual development protein (LsdA), putative n=1 Tax=Byssochlamys spectabilis (strain No. 5 / NBRC 109023) TaxID=1356009 RepID=V5FS40_BYSSN|nr:sexual development protein (LsdA), putative [Paecilomyces variotii No. 5]